MAKVMRYRDGRPRKTAEWLLYYHGNGEAIDEDWTAWPEHAKDLDPRVAREIMAELDERAAQERAAGNEHPFSYAVRDYPHE